MNLAESRTEKPVGIELPRAGLEKLGHLKKAIAKVMHGKETIIDRLLITLLAGGSVLIEDVPGVGKTTLAKFFANGIGLTFHRVQCTPDLLPADVLGFSVFRPDLGEFRFQAGPIFCNLLLLDELNRASPRTQSALLEAMAERQVTIDGVRRELEAPFMVIATQNPQVFEGTFPLPESQLDRFLFKLHMHYPSPDDEVAMLLAHGSPIQEGDIRAMLDVTELRALQACAQLIYVSRKVAEYIVEIVQRTRSDPRIRLGASPRGAVMLLHAAQARALLYGRSHVLPDDVKDLAPDVLGHRIVGQWDLNNASQSMSDQDLNGHRLIVDITERVAIPT